jgi:membrane fusion protein, hemolysin D
MSVVTPLNETTQTRPTQQAVTPAAKTSSPAPTPVQLTAADREFLPASLEILVTPPSPIARALLLTICGLFFLTIAWSYFGWIDIYAVAPGKIQPIGGSKVVQPLEPGIVTAIYVENGSHVNAGDVLLALDPTETAADREAQARDLEAASAEASRRKVAIAAAHTETLEPLPIEFATKISDPVRRREEGVLAADLAQLRSSIANFKAQLTEKLATKERLTTTIAAREKLIALAKERVAMRQRLDAMGSGARAQTIESLEQLETQITTDTGDRGQLIETDAAMRSLERKGEEAITQFVADQSQKFAEVERKRDHLEQELIKAQSKANRTELRAPITGTVQQLVVSSLGQVVASGQSLLTIVPLGGSIEVQAMIENQDIGFVEVGQPAVIKVDAFPFTRYGTINGVVEKVSRDAVDQRDANVLSDAANAAKPQSSAPGSPVKPQDLVFPATIQVTQRSINIDGKEVALIPGMGVSVEIKTGRRRAIDYLLSPLREIASRAGSER